MDENSVFNFDEKMKDTSNVALRLKVEDQQSTNVSQGQRHKTEGRLNEILEEKSDVSSNDQEESRGRNKKVIGTRVSTRMRGRHDTVAIVVQKDQLTEEIDIKLRKGTRNRQIKESSDEEMTQVKQEVPKKKRAGRESSKSGSDIDSDTKAKKLQVRASKSVDTLKTVHSTEQGKGRHR